MKKLCFLLLMLCFFAWQLNAQSEQKTKTSIPIHAKKPISQDIKEYVLQKIEQFRKRQKIETTQEYTKRTCPDAIKKKQFEFRDEYIASQKETIKAKWINEGTKKYIMPESQEDSINGIYNYDPDNKAYWLISAYFPMPFWLTVERDELDDFELHLKKDAIKWDSIDFEYNPTLDAFLLTKVTAVLLPLDSKSKDKGKPKEFIYDLERSNNEGTVPSRKKVTYASFKDNDNVNFSDLLKGNGGFKGYKKDNIHYKSEIADVDKNIPVTNSPCNNCYAIIIGNEDYKKEQMDNYNLVPVPYANRDAEVFSEYVIKTLGFPKDNVKLRFDATRAGIFREINTMNKIISNNKDIKYKVIFYFAGHGYPDENKESYILPSDANPNNLESNGITLKNLYASLVETDPERVTVFLDACFSGNTREGKNLMGKRSVAIVPVRPLLPPVGNLYVFSSSSNDETSNPYDEKGHGMFTYFLLKKIKETQGKVKYKDLSEYIRSKVYETALKINQTDQHPESFSGNTKTNPDKWELR